ncbi:MAG: hypothetical protein VYA34_14245 [Myxococcota bacterium]|nr:hypothetical protein [Myxococcota bacterium]
MITFDDEVTILIKLCGKFGVAPNSMKWDPGHQVSVRPPHGGGMGNFVSGVL